MTQRTPEPEDPSTELPERFRNGWAGGVNREDDADLDEHGAFEASDYVDDDDGFSGVTPEELRDFDLSADDDPAP